MPSGGRRPTAPGFTLIELMVTVAVIAILAVVAMPNLMSVINANRLRSQADELVGALQMARGEAIRRNSAVTVCPTEDGAECGGDSWSSWLVVDPTPLDSDPTEGVIFRGNTEAPIEVSADGAAIGFLPSGMATAQVELVACIPTTSVEDNQRVMTVLVGGGISQQARDGGGTCP